MISNFYLSTIGEEGNISITINAIVNSSNPLVLVLDLINGGTSGTTAFWTHTLKGDGQLEVVEIESSVFDGIGIAETIYLKVFNFQSINSQIDDIRVIAGNLVDNGDLVRSAKQQYQPIQTIILSKNRLLKKNHEFTLNYNLNKFTDLDHIWNTVLSGVIEYKSFISWTPAHQILNGALYILTSNLTSTTRRNIYKCNSNPHILGSWTNLYTNNSISLDYVINTGSKAICCGESIGLALSASGRTTDTYVWRVHSTTDFETYTEHKINLDISFLATDITGISFRVHGFVCNNNLDYIMAMYITGYSISDEKRYRIIKGNLTTSETPSSIEEFGSSLDINFKTSRIHEDRWMINSRLKTIILNNDFTEYEVITNTSEYYDGHLVRTKLNNAVEFNNGVLRNYIKDVTITSKYIMARGNSGYYGVYRQFSDVVGAGYSPTENALIIPIPFGYYNWIPLDTNGNIPDSSFTGSEHEKVKIMEKDNTFSLVNNSYYMRLTDDNTCELTPPIEFDGHMVAMVSTKDTYPNTNFSIITRPVRT